VRIALRRLALGVACVAWVSCNNTLSEPARAVPDVERDLAGADVPRDPSPSTDTPGDAPGDLQEEPVDLALDSTTDAPSDLPDDAPAPVDRCGAAPGQIFPPRAPWNQTVIGAPTSPDSAAVISYLQTQHDTATRFQVDFSMVVLEADADTPARAFQPTEDHFAVECDTAPIPVPERGQIEGEEGLSCIGDGDCHLLVRGADCRLFEMWRADIRGDVFLGGCLAVWETDRVYPGSGRGQDCTSADAAGLPITPLLFSAEEVAAGQIQHAVRFILPNANIRREVYVQPGTHSTSSTTGPVEAPPYGARLRLKTDVDISGLSPSAQVVAVGLQRYGMYLADAGNLTFTAASDRNSDQKWEDLEFGPHDLKSLAWSDFEVVDGGVPISYRGDCTRDVVSE
jgi:hypothetical protein